MRRYRLFLIDVLSRVLDEREFQAASDEEAKRIADEWRSGQPAELWNTHRRIARWRFEWHSC